MMNAPTPPQSLSDYVTGTVVADSGCEQNRQAVERFLVDELGYEKGDIRVDFPIAFEIGEGVVYRSALDLAVFVEGRPFMVVKTAAGSIDSWERMALAAARIISDTPARLAVSSDGSEAVILDAETGKRFGRGMSAIPPKNDAARLMGPTPPPSIPQDRLYRERLIFRSYDRDVVNTSRLKGDQPAA